MTQYCRYCFHMICGDANYCDVKDECFSDEKLKRTNSCKDFEFCSVDALGENEKGYRERTTEPTEKRDNQISIFDEVTP